MKRKKWTAMGAAALVSALFMSGCSADSSDESISTDTSTMNSQAAAAQAIVDQVSQAVNTFEAPGPAVDTAGISGGTVHYIVPAIEAAVFQTYKTLLEEAFSYFDIEVQQCGASGSDPAAVSNCLQQAIDADATAVMAMAIPYQLAPTAFDAVTEAGIPLLYTLTAPAGPGDPTKVGYFSPDFISIQAWNTAFITADSNAAADVLVIEETDNPAIQAWTQQGTLPAYESGCTDCKIQLVSSSTSQLDKLTTEITAALVANSDIGYIQLPSATYLAASIAGAQAAGLSTEDILISSMDTNVAEIAQLQQGQWLGSVVGTDFGAAAWYMADQVVRMLSGDEALQNVSFPYQRLFTRDNVEDLQATQAAWTGGEWFTAADYRSGFLELWER